MGNYDNLYDVREIKDLREMLRGSVKNYAAKNAFLSKPVKGEPYVPTTYQEFGNDVDAFGTKLYELGVQNQERVAILSETRYEWYVSYLAIVNGAGVVVPLDKALTANEIRRMLERAQVSVLIYSPKLRETALEASRGLDFLKTLVMFDTYADEENNFAMRSVSGNDAMEYSFTRLKEEGNYLLEDKYNDYLDCEIDPDEMRIMLFTSGTTDQPKAVMHSHGTIAANLMGMTEMLYINDDTVLSILPIHHTYECTCGFLCQIYRGNSIAEAEGLRYIVDNLKESQTTLLLAVPLIMESFHKKIWSNIDKKGMRKKVEFGIKLTRFLRKIGIDLRKSIFKDIHEALGGHLRLFIAGGAAIDPQVLQDFNDFGILAVQGYGLTECGPILALNRDVAYKNESAGLPLPETQVKVKDPDEEGIGEFIATGDNIMLGYYGDEELTAKALQDGWFHTGDLGYIDEDGFIIITGRKKNVIVTKNGKNIFPEELEFLLNKYPEIEESVVSSREHRNDDLLVIATIFPNMEEIEKTLGEDASLETIENRMKEIVKEVNQNVSTYKHIKEVHVRDTEFEKNTSKKIVRKYN